MSKVVVSGVPIAEYCDEHNYEELAWRSGYTGVGIRNMCLSDRNIMVTRRGERRLLTEIKVLNGDFCE